MNLALIDPFQLAQDHPDTLINVLRTTTSSATRPPLLTPIQEAVMQLLSDSVARATILPQAG